MRNSLCPHCGITLEREQTIERDGWIVTPYGDVQIDGRTIPLRASWGQILYALAATEGPVSRVALIDRISSTENLNVLSVHLSRLRRRLADEGVEPPFRTIHRNGLIWDGAKRETIEG